MAATQQPTDTFRLRFPRRVLFHLSGSQAAIDQREPDYQLFQKVLGATTRKDGSATVELTDAEAADLSIYVEAMEAGAADNTSGGWPEDMADARADLNAARAVLRAMWARANS